MVKTHSESHPQHKKNFSSKEFNTSICIQVLQMHVEKVFIKKIHQFTDVQSHIQYCIAKSD